MSHASELLAEEAARTFEQMTGYAASAIAPTATADESAALADLLARGGSSAAVILMDADVLGHVLPPCNWKTPLLRIRNRLADDGVKVFAALALPRRSGIVSATRARFVNGRVERFCTQEGIGFLGPVNAASESVASLRPNNFQERAGVAIGHGLASAAFFCCDAFRIRAPESIT
ncbi:hypothetical protein [Paraburkholderia sp. RL17-373-BIF-A]|uniref:hypothetical protein n=1 Tax=Paraburkholderia sp. RL17-373-BIF-A TaxID=3031629 RepID=UPI0038B7A50B